MPLLNRLVRILRRESRAKTVTRFENNLVEALQRIGYYRAGDINYLLHAAERGVEAMAHDGPSAPKRNPVA
jgi:hypothetical protein